MTVPACLVAAALSRESTMTAPDAPTVGAPTGGDGQASVPFTPPADDGGALITGYTATSSPGGFTGTGSSSPIVVTGLANKTAYTFTVTATNGIGTSAASAASNSATTFGVPDAPVIGTATAGAASASITFIPPAWDGGFAITGYTATSSPGGLTGTAAGSPIAVTGLTIGTAYTFTVTATNSAGIGAASAASNSVTPVKATGGDITYVGGNTIHTFLIDGTFIAGAELTVDHMIVGQGGHGPMSSSGGGGGGEVKYTAVDVVPAGSYAVVVGDAEAADNEEVSSFHSYTSLAGGRGGIPGWAGSNGACGGGGADNTSFPGSKNGGVGSPGKNGGVGFYSDATHIGAGGGGGYTLIGYSGRIATDSAGGNGGTGRSMTIRGTGAIYYGGGGGGFGSTNVSSSNYGGLGGAGGGGNGAYGTGVITNGTPGTPNSGGGGGAGGGAATKGGSGIVVIRYPT